MPKEISDNEALQFGISTNHELMENGEKRFRLISSDETSYIRIEASENGGWQNSHLHSSVREMCIIQKGRVFFAEEKNGKVQFYKYEKGDFFIAQSNIPHNVYASGGTITHTVKYGDIENNDWIACPELDKITKILSEYEVLELAKP